MITAVYMAKFSDLQRESAKVAAFNAYQSNLLDAYLFGATDEEKREMCEAFKADTKNGAFLIVNGTGSKVSENGELTTKDKDGNVEVWAGAYVFSSLTWKVDKDGNVTETRDFFRAPIAVDTWVRCERIVNAWLDYATRKYQGVLDAIEERREKVRTSCDNLTAAAAALLEFTDSLPEKFITKYKDAYSEGIRFGYVFSDEINDAFKLDEK